MGMDLTQVGHMPTLPSIPDPTPQQLHRARLAVCARATDPVFTIDGDGDQLTFIGTADVVLGPLEPRSHRSRM